MRGKPVDRGRGNVMIMTYIRSNPYSKIREEIKKEVFRGQNQER